MNLDTQIFFLIVLGGVMMVWSFRETNGTSKDLKEIEYLTFACFWGTLLVLTHAGVMKHVDSDGLKNLLENPFASGLVFSSVGLLVGSSLGVFDRRLKIRQKLIEFLKYLETRVFD